MRIQHRNGNRLEGFTLIELMIVVAVIAILATIAYPSYQEAIRKSRRAQAKADLVEAAQIAERWHTVNNTYDGVSLGFASSPRTGTKHYDIATGTPDAGTFTFTATPVPGTDQANDRCGTLSINQAGARHHSAGTPADCQFGTVAP